MTDEQQSRVVDAIVGTPGKCLLMVGSPWDGLIVVCGASWWEGTPLLEHHVAEELTRYAPVLYVDPPSSAADTFPEP